MWAKTPIGSDAAGDLLDEIEYLQGSQFNDHLIGTGARQCYRRAERP